MNKLYNKYPMAFLISFILILMIFIFAPGFVVQAVSIVLAAIMSVFLAYMGIKSVREGLKKN